MEEAVSYKQLEPEERITIASLKQQGSSVRAIARTLGRSPGTVSRELHRNDSAEWGYTSAAAQALCTSRRAAARPARKLEPEGALWQTICGIRKPVVKKITLLLPDEFTANSIEQIG